MRIVNVSRRAMLYVVLAVVALSVAPSLAHAQTVCSSPCTLTLGAAYSVAADHDGLNTTGYRVYVDGVKVGNDVPLSQLASGAVTISGLVAPGRGQHSLQVAAFNEDWETKSDPFVFTVKKQPPGKPGNTRILIAVTASENGSVSFKVIAIEANPNQ
jgi:hypothetical protein